MFTIRHLSRCLLAVAVSAIIPLGSVAAASDEGDGASRQDVMITEQEQQRYERRMRETLDEWGDRVESATAAGSEKAEAMTEAGRRELSAVWSDVQQDWRKLENASGQAWQESREAFEDSMHSLEERWKELQP